MSKRPGKRPLLEKSTAKDNSLMVPFTLETLAQTVVSLRWSAENRLAESDESPLCRPTANRLTPASD
ncbi:MAG: hypothetical protein K1Y02_24105 [Candidatus Hydrogenedentes bacterium]|nr:hypothetical protein [Candidatus Hydrogenedentota bacterium]